jgi:vitamin B12 transporter
MSVLRRHASATLLLSGVVSSVSTAQRDSTDLPRVVITATRVESPVAVRVTTTTVLDARRLQDRGVHTLAEALRTVPGVTVVQSGGPGAQTSLFLRGGESDYVRVLVDGVAVNDPGGAIDLASYTLDNVDRIEIVRGPASVLYGSDAVTGVVQVFTSRAPRRPGVDATVSVSSDAGRSVLLASGGRAGRLTATAAYAHRRSDGVLAFNNRYRNDVASGSLSASGTHGRVTLSARRQRDRFHYPTDGSGAVVDRNAYRAGTRQTVSLDASRRLGRWSRLDATLAAVDAQGRTDDASDGPGDTLGFHTYRDEATVRRRVADARVHLFASAAGIATFGAEFSQERQRSRDSSNLGVSANTFAERRSTRALYAQWVGERGRLQYSAGTRYDDNTVFGVFRTARVGAALAVWRGGTVRGATGTAFKAPAFIEQFNTAFSVGNAGLRPERTRSTEFGISHRTSGGRFTAAATWFQQRFRDLIQYTWVEAGTANYFNVAEATSRGLELETLVQLTPRVLATGSSTMLRTRVENPGFDAGEGATFVHGARLLRRPPLTVSVGLRAQPGSGVTVDLSARRIATRDDRDFGGFPPTPRELHAYTRLDAGSTIELPRSWTPPSLSLVLRAENLLGTRYEEVANFAAPGRVVSVGLRVRTSR